MGINEFLKEQICEIIMNQLKDNDPPETKETFDRWVQERHDEFQSKQMARQSLPVELFDVIKHCKP